jgi:peptide subunit release factor 1 (eRF1)
LEWISDLRGRCYFLGAAMEEWRAGRIMSRLIVTEDLAECPQCGAPVVKTSDRARQCNSCGLAWERVTEDDELDAEAERLVRSRGWNEERGRAKSIGKFQTRW